MKFEKNEIPAPAITVAARSLSKGDIVFDEYSTPWVVCDVDKDYKRNTPLGDGRVPVQDATTGEWIVAARQAVYSNDMRGNGWIAGKGPTCVMSFKPDGQVPIYSQEELLRVVELDMDKYLSYR